MPKDLQNTQLCLSVAAHRPRFITPVAFSVCLLLTLILSACGANLGSNVNASSSANAASLSNATIPSNATGYSVKVYFSRYPDSLNSNFNAVYAVNRVSPTIAVASFSIQLLIAGPTLSEQQAGYFSELNTLFSGPSNCAAPRPVGGPDFTVTLDKRGSKPQTGTATLTFCRLTLSPGIGADARVTAEINATLKQFPRIKNVVILTKDGHCFGDESGKDHCLG